MRRFLSEMAPNGPGERTGLRRGLWPSSYQVTAHLVGGRIGPPRERVDRSDQRHCAGPTSGQTRAEEAWERLSQSHFRLLRTVPEINLLEAYGQLLLKFAIGGLGSVGCDHGYPS